MKFRKLVYLVVGMLLSGTFALSAHANIIVSTGYYYEQSLPTYLPDPWYGSSLITNFNGDTVLASSSKPDESAVLIFNDTSQAISLSSFYINTGSNTYNEWTGFIGGGELIAAGKGVIFSGTTSFGMDGSDDGMFDNTSEIHWTINGISGSAVDTTGVLTGFSLDPNNSNDESHPWYQIASVSAVPEPETYGMMLMGLGMIGFIARRRSNSQA